MHELPTSPMAPPLEAQESIAQAMAEHETALRELLDPSVSGEAVTVHPNYEYAKDSGLLDLFYFNPLTGEDSLRHILEGDMVVGSHGAREVAGFHHEPSSRRPDTYVDLAHLEGRNSQSLRDYRRFPYEPYSARVVIQGYDKSALRKRPNGSSEVMSAKNSMFPREYDPLAIMQAAKLALETRDRRQDEPKSKDTLVTEGFAPMLNGVDSMKLRLVLDAPTEKILTVFPVVRQTSVMKLTSQTALQHLGLQSHN